MKALSSWRGIYWLQASELTRITNYIPYETIDVITYPECLIEGRISGATRLLPNIPKCQFVVNHQGINHHLDQTYNFKKIRQCWLKMNKFKISMLYQCFAVMILTRWSGLFSSRRRERAQYIINFHDKIPYKISFILFHYFIEHIKD